MRNSLNHGQSVRNIIRQKVTPNLRFYQRVRDFGHARCDCDGGVGRDKFRDGDATCARLRTCLCDGLALHGVQHLRKR